MANIAHYTPHSLCNLNFCCTFVLDLWSVPKIRKRVGKNMRTKNQIIRDVIYDEVRKAYPSWISCSDIAKSLKKSFSSAISSRKVRYYLDDMFFSQGYPPKLLRCKQFRPRLNEYKAIL